MRIAKSTLLALGACALMVGAGCGAEEKTVEVEVPTEVDEGQPVQLPADVQDAMDDATEKAQETIDDATKKVEAVTQTVDELKAARKAEVQALKATMAEKIADLEAQLKADPMKAMDLQNTIKDLTAEYEAKIEKVRADYKAKIEAAE